MSKTKNNEEKLKVRLSMKVDVTFKWETMTKRYIRLLSNRHDSDLLLMFMALVMV